MALEKYGAFLNHYHESDRLLSVQGMACGDSNWSGRVLAVCADIRTAGDELEKVYPSEKASKIIRCLKKCVEIMKDFHAVVAKNCSIDLAPVTSLTSELKAKIQKIRNDLSKMALMGLNKDILIHILTHLDGKSLKNLKCVSQAWNAFIITQTPYIRNLKWKSLFSHHTFDQPKTHHFTSAISLNPDTIIATTVHGEIVAIDPSGNIKTLFNLANSTIVVLNQHQFICYDDFILNVYDIKELKSVLSKSITLRDKITVVNDHLFVFLGGKIIGKFIIRDLMLCNVPKKSFARIEDDCYSFYPIPNEKKNYCLYFKGQIFVLNTMNKVHLEDWQSGFPFCLTSYFAIFRYDKSFIIWSVKNGKKIKEFTPDQSLIKIKETQNPHIFLIVKRENEVYQLSLYDLQKMEELDLGLTIDHEIEEIYSVNENHSLLHVREPSTRSLYDCNFCTKTLKLIDLKNSSSGIIENFHVKKISTDLMCVEIDKIVERHDIKEVCFLKYVDDKVDPEIIPYEPNSIQRHVFFGDNTILITDRDDAQTLLRY